MLLTILIVAGIVLIVFGVMIWPVAARRKWLMPSTLKFIREGGLGGFLNLSTLHGYVYMRWMKSYLAVLINRMGPRASQPAAKRLSDRYHGKVLTEHQAQTLITINKDIPYQNLEQDHSVSGSP